jgi:hypothetical protein
MDEADTKLGRRGFLGSGAAALAGAGIATGISAAIGPALRFVSTDDLFPDAPAVVEIDGALLRGARVVRVRLVVDTPRGRVTLEQGAHRVSRDEPRVAVRLTYPYEDFVVGDYRYHAELDLGERTLRTREAAAYDVRRVAWFS